MWLGLDNPLMYAAHKAAGGMTSIYRQIGIGCQNLFSMILQDELGLSNEQTRWSYSVRGANNKVRTLSLDGRITLADVQNQVKRSAIKIWIFEICEDLGVNRGISDNLQGIVFEIRQGYKSKDSKRQNADISNAATAYSQAYLPCLALFSMQMDEDLFYRYRAEKWSILSGNVIGGSVMNSTYIFMRDIVGYDLAAFFERHSAVLHAEIAEVLEALLQAE
jgi:hypothetical protein